MALSKWAQSVHVVGLAGAGVRGIVHLLHERGVKITGSELLDSPVLEKFRRRGIDCRVGHASGNVEQGTSFVLISAAVKDSNPEVTAARNRSIPVLKYAECLGRLMGEKEGIAIAGTHGKTTTTAMVASIFSEAGMNPSFVIGGDYTPLGGSARWGDGPHFVAEACEFDRSFLNLHPKMSIVTNIEEDHLDYFESLKEIQGAFADFVSHLPEDGYLVVNRDDPNSSYLSEFCRSAVGTFSLRPHCADWWADEIIHENGGSRFLLAGENGERARVRLSIPGTHNISNALAATAVSRRAGVPLERIAQVLPGFTGVRRRFDILRRKPVMVVDDYAHHPTEIQAVLRAARQSLPDRRLIAVFQPHQHSRLKKFRFQFAEILSRFDSTLVCDVYQARDKEEDIRTIRSDSLVQTINDIRGSAKAFYTPGFADVLEVLRRRAQEGDAVIFLGAGSITDLAEEYAKGPPDKGE
jgi:UDP-N-acetylmuramate--alanine ligase